jgi:hypothetical protein
VRWRAGDGTGAAAAFDDGARRCQARLGRCERLFAARYAFAIALVGGAACRVGEAAGDALLAAAMDELSRAIANCHGRGILVATSKDLAALRDGGARGTDALTALLDAALADGIAG